MKKEFYTTKEAADILEVSPLTVYRWASSGKLKALKIGRTVRIPASTLFEEVDNAIIERGLVHALGGVH